MVELCHSQNLRCRSLSTLPKGGATQSPAVALLAPPCLRPPSRSGRQIGATGSPSGVSLGFSLGFLGLLGLGLLLPSAICVVVGGGGEAAHWGRRGGVLYVRPSQGGAFGASSPPSASRRKARGSVVPRGGRISASPGGAIWVVFLESGGAAHRCCSLPVFVNAGA
jgi:hypothetical protein